MKKYKDLYKLEPGHYFLRVDLHDPRVRSMYERDIFVKALSSILGELGKAGMSISVIEARKGSLEFIPKPTKEKSQ